MRSGYGYDVGSRTPEVRGRREMERATADRQVTSRCTHPSRSILLTTPSPGPTSTLRADILSSSRNAERSRITLRTSSYVFFALATLCGKLRSFHAAMPRSLHTITACKRRQHPERSWGTDRWANADGTGNIHILDRGPASKTAHDRRCRRGSVHTRHGSETGGFEYREKGTCPGEDLE